MDIEDSRGAASEGRLRTLPRFGEESERWLLASIEDHVNAAHRFTLSFTSRRAENLGERCQAMEGVAVVGSSRRAEETVGDLDLVIVAAGPAAVADPLQGDRDVAEVLASGDTKLFFRPKAGAQVDMRLVPSKCVGAALRFFTGSRPHNIAVRRLGLGREPRLTRPPAGPLATTAIGGGPMQRTDDRRRAAP